jgi:hypothetical protein
MVVTTALKVVKERTAWAVGDGDRVVAAADILVQSTEAEPPLTIRRKP